MGFTKKEYEKGKMKKKKSIKCLCVWVQRTDTMGTNTYTYINGGRGREGGQPRFGGSRRPYGWGKIGMGEGG